MRAFVAIEVGEALESKSGTDAKGTSAHLTLRFLGEISEALVEPIATELRGVAQRTPAFELTLEGIGAFPSRHQPRVVWVGVTHGSDRVVRLATDVSDALVGLGFGRPRQEAVPHVTLFRVRSASGREHARRLLAGTEAPPPLRVVRVAEISLQESTKSPDGVRHRTRERFPLGPAVGRSAALSPVDG